MKKIILTIISVIAALSSVEGFASGLVPRNCTIENNSRIFYQLSYIGYYFNCKIGVVGNPVGTVYSEDQPVATGAISVTNYVGTSRTEGKADVIFDPALILPKGKTYRLVVPAGAIYMEGDRTVTNDELTVEFLVPENLGNPRPPVENGSVVEKDNLMYFTFGTEIAEEGNGEVFLYRKDVPVKKYPCYASWDWNLGHAGIYFDKDVYFESGVEYTIRLPKDCVRSRYRSDITNEEATVNFFGGYTGHVVPLKYTGCSLTNSQPSDVLGEVRFFYYQPITLCVTPNIQLFNESDGVVVKEAVPTVSKENIRYVMTVDFENTTLVPGKEYSIIIPEATVVMVRSDIMVNQRNTVPVVNNSGVSEIEDTDCEINVENGSVTVDGTSAGASVTLFTLDGKVLFNARSNGGTVSIPVGTTGIYLLSVNGKTHKIAVGN